MDLYPPPLELKDTEGFTPQKDIFNRKYMGEGLKRIVTESTQPLVIALDGQWGSGKSTFLQMWAGELRRSNYPVIYYDAFANDYSEDVFASISSEIFELFESLYCLSDENNQKFLDNFVELAKKLSVIVGKGALGAFLNRISFGEITSKNMDDLRKIMIDSKDEAIDHYAKKWIKEAKNRKALINEFKNKLSELAIIYKYDGNNRPLIFIIDELDRCKPSFALETLEIIKHFYSVQNIHFVFGVNLEQIYASVKSIYGADIDASNYMEKFISLKLSIKTNEKRIEDSQVKKYIEYLFDNMDIKFKNGNNMGDYKSFLIKFAHVNQLNYRTIEKIVAKTIIIVNFMREHDQIFYILFSGLVILNICYENEYKNVKNKSYNYKLFEEIFGLNQRDDVGYPIHSDWVVSLWKFFSNSEMTESESLEIKRSLSRYMLENRENYLSNLANNFVDRFY